MRLWIAVLLGLLASGCEESGQRQEPAERPRLVSEEEIRSFEKQLLAEVEEIKRKTCPRPVLRGKPEEGAATEDMVALVEGIPELASCREMLKVRAEMLKNDLLHPEDQPPPGMPERNMQTAREAGQPVKELQALDAACRQVAGLIQKAVRHEDACSPYRPGLRGQPDYLSMMGGMLYAAYRARALIAGGKAQQGFELLLDSLRFCQDFYRGGASVLEAMVAVGAMRPLLPVIEQGLNRPEALGQEPLEQVGDELGALILSQPHPSTFLRGEIQSMSLYTFMPVLKGSGWTPPGGWGKDMGPGDLRFAAPESGLDEVESNALAYIAMQETGREWLLGCKPDELPIECHRHMQKLGQALQKNTDARPGSIAALLKFAFAEDKIQEIRRQIIQILKSIASPSFEKYLAKEGKIRFALAALRLQAAYRRLAEKNKNCPEVSAFEQAPLKELRSDPFSGGQISIESAAPGKLVLRPPVPLGKQGGDDAEPAVLINCPYGK